MAVEYYRLAAEQADAMGEASLAEAYLNGIGLTSSKLTTCSDPVNIKCSSRWASPVKGTFSSLEPTLYNRLTATISVAASW